MIFGAFAQVAPDRAIAGCNSSCTTAIFSGSDPHDPSRFYVYLETIAGGAGASAANDGLSGVQVHMTNTSNLPVEALEMEYPYLEVLEYSLIPDSGGAGKTRGGLGILRRFEIRRGQYPLHRIGRSPSLPALGAQRRAARFRRPL